MNKSLVRFEFEKSPLHTIVYGATGTGKTCFVRQYLNLYQESCFEDQGTCFADDRRSIIIICKDEKDWIDPVTGKPCAGIDMGIITMKNILKFKNSVIVLDDMGDKFYEDIAYYFTEGRNINIQMIVLCHKPAHINNMAKMNSDTIYITTYNEADVLQIFNTTYNCKHGFHDISQELNNKYYNCTDGTADALRYGMIKYDKKEETFIFIDKNRTMIYDSRVGLLDLKALSLKDGLESNEVNKILDYIKSPMNSATDRNTINKDNYIFYFTKPLT